MSAKGFLNKATRPHLSAAGFLAKHREYMTTGELAPVLSPIIVKLDQAKAEALAAQMDTESLAKEGLGEIARAVMQHIIVSDCAKATVQANKPVKEVKKVVREVRRKNWTAAVYNAAGEVQTRINAKGEVENLVKGFDLSGDADRWLDRRLALDVASDCYGQLKHSHSRIEVKISREDAMARLYKQGAGMVMKHQSKTTSSLSFGVRVKNDKANFSHG